MVDFADLDDLDTAIVRDSVPHAHTPVMQKCVPCAGRGQVLIGYVNQRYVPCRICQGKGEVSGKRLKGIAAAKKARVTRATNLRAAIESFERDHPEEYALLQAATSSQFLTSLREQLDQRGTLSEKQIAKLTEFVAVNRERKAAAIAAKSVDLGSGPKAMFDAVMKAHMLGTKRPTFRTEVIIFSMAPDSGANAGHLYVKTRGGTYLGKINDSGLFITTRECTPDLRETVIAVASDPLTAAVDYGKRTGICACCGRELSDEISVQEGIGPICKSKYF